MRTKRERIAWAGGLFEGEGWLIQHQSGRQSYMSAGIEMTDRETLERFAQMMAEHGIDRELGTRWRGNPKHKRQYDWKVTGARAVQVFLLLRPYLGTRRREKGDALVDAHNRRIEELTKPRVCPGCGETFRPKSVYAHRAVACSDRCRARIKRSTPEGRAAANERSRRYKERQRRKRR